MVDPLPLIESRERCRTQRIAGRAARLAARSPTPVAFAWPLRVQPWLRAAPVRLSEDQDVGRSADDLRVVEDMSLGFEEAPAQPARGVDLGSGGQTRPYGGSAADLEVAARFPAREGEGLACTLRCGLAEVVRGRFGEADDEGAGGGLAHAGVGGKGSRAGRPDQ